MDLPNLQEVYVIHKVKIKSIKLTHNGDLTFSKNSTVDIDTGVVGIYTNFNIAHEVIKTYEKVKVDHPTSENATYKVYIDKIIINKIPEWIAHYPEIKAGTFKAEREGEKMWH